MTQLTVARTPAAWRAQPGETQREHLSFLYWALAGGPVQADLAAKHHWTERKNVLDAYESIDALSPAEQMTEAAAKQVAITLIEANKLHRRVLEDKEAVLAPREVLASIEWMTKTSIDLAQRRAEAMDWAACTPEEREILLHAKRIQDRLLGKE